MQKKTSSLLITHAEYVVPMNEADEIKKNCSIYIEGKQIIEIGSKRTTADTVISGKGKIVIPGFINCHHHLFQCGLRGMPLLQNQQISKWIRIVCKYAENMSEELMYWSALANMAELLLYGCTTTTDMMYVFPKGKKLFEPAIQAGQDIGIRFHPYRGSMSVGEKQGGLFPDTVTQNEEKIIEETEAVIRKYHDTSPFAMTRIGVAPCTLFTSSKKEYQHAVLLSKKYNVNLQTHLSESAYEATYAMEKYNKRPLQFLSDLGWGGPRVSFSHCIDVNTEEISKLASSHTHVVHCPISNARASMGEAGIAPIWDMVKKHINVAIGVDGSAGNDSSNVLEELRWARTLQGVSKKSTYLKSLDVLRMGSFNGAKLLNWQESIGSLEVGKAADIALFDLQAIESAGAQWDPVTMLISTQARRAETVIVNGKLVVQNKHLIAFDEENIVEKLNTVIKKEFKNYAYFRN